jgi:hypothetical protein
VEPALAGLKTPKEALINSALLVAPGCATKTDGDKLLVLREK